MRTAPKGSPPPPLDERTGPVIVRVRARVEHPFRLLNGRFGHAKTRGLARTRARHFTLFAPGDLFLVRRGLMTWARICPQTGYPPQSRHETGELRRKSGIERAV